LSYLDYAYPTASYQPSQGARGYATDLSHSYINAPDPPISLRTYKPVSTDSIVINMSEFDKPPETDVINWSGKLLDREVRIANYSGYPLNASQIRAPASINQIVLHETAYRVNYFVNNAVKYAPHFCIELDGTICQFFDLCEFLQHTERDFSNLSIGIEFTNDPWKKQVSGDYSSGELITVPKIIGLSSQIFLPPVSQLEPLVALIKWLQAQLSIGNTWHSLISNPDPTKIPETPARTKPSYFIFSNARVLIPGSQGAGIYNHGAVSRKGGHGDGFIQNFYSWLRIDQGFNSARAYELLKEYLTSKEVRKIYTYDKGSIITLLDVQAILPP
jgi:N-acetylmuramoyl-L-alanine amidase